MNTDGKRILVVLNDPTILSLISKILQAKGYVVHRAGNGKEALAILDTEPVDLIVSDVRMEPVDGFQLLGAVRDKFTDLQVIMVTTYPTEATETACRANGAFAHIPMPFKIDHFLLTVRRALEKPASNYDRC